jgi:ribonuclease VapC
MIIDTSALMSILLSEADAETYATSLHSASQLAIAAPTWLECSLVITSKRGAAGQEIFVELINALAVEIVPFDAALAQLAYNAWLRFGKGRHPAALNMGDCFSYALAKQRGESLLFKGEDFRQTDILLALSRLGE